MGEIDIETLREHVYYKARWLEYVIEHRKDRYCPFRPSKAAVDRHKSVLAMLRKLLKQREVAKK
jgi:hypothetical protein